MGEIHCPPGGGQYLSLAADCDFVVPLGMHASSSPTSRTQRDRILRVLIEARGQWVPLTAILALNIAQYNSRLLELRRLGFAISNRREGSRSWFRLEGSPKLAPRSPDCGVEAEEVVRAGTTSLPQEARSLEGPGLLFPDLKPAHRDPA